eukprot:1089509_1
MIKKYSELNRTMRSANCNILFISLLNTLPCFRYTKHIVRTRYLSDEDSDDEGEPGDGNVAAASNTNSKRGTKRQRGSDVIVTEPPRKKAKKAHNKKKQQNKKKNKPKPSSTLQISDGFSFL